MSKKNLKLIAITLIALLSFAVVTPVAKSQQQDSVPSYEPLSASDLHLVAASEAGNYVIQAGPEGASCRVATREESQALAQRDQLLELHTISQAASDEVGPQDAGLKIFVRGTPQLENFPVAKNAFLRGVQRWEEVIRSPIAMILDVDFGPTRFGFPYDAGIIGGTVAQDIGAASIYAPVRQALISGASSARESELYNALPVGAVPTDLGGTTAMNAPSAVFRALGLISPVANPGAEANFGPVPSIGFNSAFEYDFDPSDGIDADKLDFDTAVVHEIGHALGFGSEVGAKELDQSANLALSIEDLFRFRPGMTLGTFSTARRILSSGGTHVFFAGGTELLLSTGRMDHTGGDRNQASHWKDDRISGQYLGIMDPTLSEGQRQTLTNNDLLALDAMGYQVGTLSGGGDTVALTSGVPQQGSIRAPKPNEEDAVIDDQQYTIQVPSGASQLTVELSGNQDVDLYVRAAQRVAVSSSGFQTDYVSESETGLESITITPSSTPALRAATYYVAVLNYGPGAASFTIKATVTGGSGGGSNSPVITSLQGELKGDDLILAGVVADSDGDIAQAQSDLLDGSGQVVGGTQPFAVNLGSSPTVEFSLKITNLNAFPAAVMATVTFIDRGGHRSAPQTTNFSGGDSGGPRVSGASYVNNRLTIKGASFSAQVVVEINGRVVGIYASATDRKLKVKGDPNRLGLHAGPNRLRVLNGNLRSNLFVLEL